MKKILLGVGILLLIASVLSLAPYLADYNELSQYGKGFIWGKLLLLVIGIALIFFGVRRK